MCSSIENAKKQNSDRCEEIFGCDQAPIHVQVFDFVTGELLVSERFDVQNTLLIGFLDDKTIWGRETNEIVDQIEVFNVEVRG